MQKKERKKNTVNKGKFVDKKEFFQLFIMYLLFSEKQMTRNDR